MSWRAGVAGALIAIAGGLGGCTEPPARNPDTLVMPSRGQLPPRLNPVDTIEVDDSEDARLVGTGAPELLGAVEAYHAKNTQAALSRFFEVMRDPLRSGTPRQLAELFAAKALLDLELPHASWMILDRIAAQPSHPLRRNALPWFGVLASNIDTDAVLESLATYDASELTKLDKQQPPLLERLAYLFGRRAFLRGDDAGAQGLLGRVSTNAVDYPKALFMLGVVDVRAKRTEAALETFDEVIRALTRPGLDEPERISAMASMARARVLYQLGEEQPAKLEQALAIYEKLKTSEEVADDALVEGVWARFKLGRTEEALRELEAARPKLSTRHAELDELEVRLLLDRCSLDRAETALASAQARHRLIRAQIDEMVKLDLASLVPKAIAIGIQGAEPRSPSDEVLAIAVRRVRLARILRRFGEIRDEAKRADALPLDFKESAPGKKVKSLVDEAIARTRGQVGEHLDKELRELGEITDGYLQSMDELEAELARRKRDGCR